jgi:SAM-dependent methyltransferase
MPPEATVLDVGCGPGFLAYEAAKSARKVFACDLSPGVIACAQVLNSQPNIAYFSSLENGYSPVPDQTLDLVYSFAVIQHVGDDVFSDLMAIAFQKLKVGGQLVLDFPVEYGDIKDEAAWREDRTIRGRLKLRFGLNLFARERESFSRLIAQAGFTNLEYRSASRLFQDIEDDVTRQDLLVAQKPCPSAQVSESPA